MIGTMCNGRVAFEMVALKTGNTLQQITIFYLFILTFT